MRPPQPFIASAPTCHEPAEFFQSRPNARCAAARTTASSVRRSLTRASAGARTRKFPRNCSRACRKISATAPASAGRAWKNSAGKNVSAPRPPHADAPRAGIHARLNCCSSSPSSHFVRHAAAGARAGPRPPPSAPRATAICASSASPRKFIWATTAAFSSTTASRRPPPASNGGSAGSPAARKAGARLTCPRAFCFRICMAATCGCCPSPAWSSPQFKLKGTNVIFSYGVQCVFVRRAKYAADQREQNFAAGGHRAVRRRRAGQHVSSARVASQSDV